MGEGAKKVAGNECQPPFFVTVLVFLRVKIRIHADLAKTSPVIPAKAGIHSELDRAGAVWIPACAGMTES